MLGYLYQITLPNNEYYIGSTICMETREKQHRLNSKTFQAKLYKSIRENGGEFEMVLLYDYECENETELKIEERKLYDALLPSLNTLRPYTTKTERRLEGCLYQKQYAQENAEEIREYRKKRRESGVENTNRIARRNANKNKNK